MKQIQSIGASWLRSFLAASLAVYMAGESDPKTIGMAGLAAVLPVIFRFLNPADESFGITKGK
jgi:hypothetical protein